MLSLVSFWAIGLSVRRLIWIIVVATASLAAAPLPEDAALSFFAQLRDQHISFEPGGGTAISRVTSKAKQREIEDRWQRILQDAKDKQVSVGPFNHDADMAAVILRLTKGYDPANQQVVAVALVNQHEQWLPAPLPGSFENTGLGFGAQRADRIARLVQWMELEQVRELQGLRDASAERLQTDMRASISEEQLRKLSAVEAIQAFLVACEERNLPLILGFLGGLEQPLPDDWLQRLRAIEMAVHEPRKADLALALLMDPQVPKVVAQTSENKESCHALVACMSTLTNSKAASSPRLQLIELDVYRSFKHSWRFDLPERLSDSQAVADGADPHSEKLLMEVVHRWREKWPSRAPRTVDSLLEQLLQAHSAADATRELSDRTSPQLSLKAYSQALAFWNQFQGLERSSIPWNAKRMETADETWILLEMVSLKHPDRLVVQKFHFIKDGDAWKWQVKLGDEAEDPAMNQWFEDEKQAAEADWPAPLIAHATIIEPTAVFPAPSEELAKALVEEWHAALRKRELAEAIRTLAVLPDKEGHSRWLRNLAYEISQVTAEATTEIGEPTTRGPLTAVPVEVRNGEQISRGLSLVIGTAQGAKILLEVDLIPSSQRARGFLNRTAIDRLRDSAMPQSAEAASSLLKLYESVWTDSAE